jgi:NTP pyrophosphatase (non-canonical NTP hydrolase)
MDIEAMNAELREFVREREWEQFHSPKNLVMALSGEAAELIELFQWLTEEQSRAVMSDPDTAEAVRDEVADVFVYVMRLIDVLDIDLEAAVRAKMKKNAAKYPVERAKGLAKKYTEL